MASNPELLKDDVLTNDPALDPEVLEGEEIEATDEDDEEVEEDTDEDEEDAVGTDPA